MAVKCSAITNGGSRCSRPALVGKPHCLMHDPDSAELRREASRKGGRARSNQARAAKVIPTAMSVADLAGYLSQLFTSTVIGETEPKVASAAAGIARVLLEAQTAASQPAIEDLQEQIAVLRIMIDRGVGGRAA